MTTIVFDPPHADVLSKGSTMAGLQLERVRAILWMTVIFWGSNVLFLTLATALTHNPHLPQIAAMRLLTTVLGLVLCFLIHLLLTRPFLSSTRNRLIALAIVAPVAAECFAWVSYFAEIAVDPSLRQPFTWSGAVRAVAFWTWFFLAWAGLYLAVSYSFDAREEQQLSAEIREREHAAQLRALHSQINPHFLFNSLNSLSALILDKKTELAEQMVVKLSNFLRMGLAADPKAKIALSSEMELQQAYLELEQIRYRDLRTEFSVPADLLAARVPALILQPLVENAVKYGVAGAMPPARIEVSARSDSGRLALEVKDSGKGNVQKQSGSGIGLANVLQRLRLIYGPDRVDLMTRPSAKGEFIARITFPLELV